MRLSRLVLLLAALSIGLLGACGQGSDEEAGGQGAGNGTARPLSISPSLSPSSLAGRTFVSQRVTVQGADYPLASAAPISLRFEGGGLTASAGCNHLSVEFSIEDAVLVLGQRLVTTAMGCEAALMAQDQWLGGQLGARPTLSLDGGTLTLRGPSSEIVLLDGEVSAPSSDLEGVTWRLTGVTQADVASSNLGGVTVSFQLANGELTFQGACNQGGGKARIDGQRLLVESIMTTERACLEEVGSELGRMELDELVLNMLEASPTFGIKGPHLQLDNGTGQALTFIATR